MASLQVKDRVGKENDIFTSKKMVWKGNGIDRSIDRSVELELEMGKGIFYKVKD